MVNLQVRLLSDGKEKKNYIKHHGQMLKQWDEYTNQERSAKQLLKAIAHHIAVFAC